MSSLISLTVKAGKFRASSITTTPVCRLAISPCPCRFAAVSCKANLWSFRKTPITANTSSLSHAIFWIKNPVIPHGGEPIESTGDYGDTDLVRRYSVAYLRNEQDDDLSALGVRFDNFFLESSLYTTGAVQKTVQAIIDAGYTYEADNALWLRTTAFEDLGNGLRR